MEKVVPIRGVSFLPLFLAFLMIFSSGCEEKMYDCTRHDKEGNLKSIVRCNGEGVYMGEYLEYHKTGKLWKRSYFVDGLEEDTTRLYFYKTGNVLRETPMLHGKKHGGSVTYREDGSVEELVTYEEGVKSGPSTVFYENGSPKETFTYQQGQLSGPYFFHAPDSTLIVQGEYHNGAKYGIWSHYDYDGSLLGEFSFYNNMKEGPFRVLRANGEPLVSGTFEQDLLQGAVSFYESDGAVAGTEMWKKGSPVGPSASGAVRPGQVILRHDRSAVYIMPDTLWVTGFSGS